MSKQLQHYTREQKIEAATHYAIHGSLAKIERDLDIPKTTAHYWKGNDDLFNETIEQIRTEKQDEHIAKYHALVSDAIDHAHSRLDDASPKDALIMAATATDKARLLMAAPQAAERVTESLNTLAKQFEDIAQSFKEKQVKDQRAIEGEIVRDTEHLNTET